MGTSKKDYLTTVYTGLNNQLDKQVDALSKDFNKPRFLQNCMTVLQDGNADFSKCSASTLIRTLLRGAYLNLDFFLGECYAIPYGSNVQFQTDYKGEIKLAKKYSVNPIKDIYAKLVREGDDFSEEIINGEQTVKFRPKPFNDGKIKGVFAVCLYEDGSMIYEAMSIAEVNDIRDKYSKTAKGPAWTKSYGEMVKKTCLRRLCKLITLDFETEEAKDAYTHGGEDETIIDVLDDAEEVIEEQTASEPDPAEQPKEEPKAEQPKEEADGQMNIAPGF